MTSPPKRNAPARSGNSGEGNGYLDGQSKATLPPDRVSHPLWLDGYFWGNVHGLDRGRELADAEAAEDWAGVARYVQRLGSPQYVPYAELCERRGEPERAARARDHEARLGLVDAS